MTDRPDPLATLRDLSKHDFLEVKLTVSLDSGAETSEVIRITPALRDVPEYIERIAADLAKRSANYFRAGAAS